MSDDDQTRRERLGEWVRAYRKKHPKFTHDYIKDAYGPTGPVVTRIENAEPVKPFSLRALERSLDLAEGTLAKVADGRELRADFDALESATDDELVAELQRRLQRAQPGVVEPTPFNRKRIGTTSSDEPGANPPQSNDLRAVALEHDREPAHDDQDV